MWIRMVVLWVALLSVVQAADAEAPVAFMDAPSEVVRPFQLSDAVALRDAPGRRLHRVGAGLGIGGFGAVALSIPVGILTIGSAFGGVDSPLMWVATSTLFFGGAAAAVTGVSLMTAGTLRSSAYTRETLGRVPLRGLSVASPVLLASSVGLAVWAFNPGGEGYKIFGAGVLLATAIALPVIEQSASGRALRGAGFTDVRVSPSLNGLALSGRF